MATVTSFTAERMQEIENETIVDASIIGGHLMLERRDGVMIDAGTVDGVSGPPGVDGLGVEFLDLAESSAGLPDGTKVCRRYT